MTKLKKQPYRIIKCPRLCSINDYNLPAGLGGLIHAWIEEATPDAMIEARSEEHGHKVSERAVRNHRLKHLVPENKIMKDTVIGTRPDVGDGTDQSFSDLDVIEQIIKAGGKQLMARQAQVSPEMTMRAIELKYKMTQGSMMDDFFRAMGMVMDDATAAEALTENPEATDGEVSEAQGALAHEQGSLDVQAVEARDGDEVPTERTSEASE